MRVRGLTLVAIAALVFGACSSTPAASTAPSAAANAAPSARRILGCPLDCAERRRRRRAAHVHDHERLPDAASTRSASRPATSSASSSSRTPVSSSATRPRRSSPASRTAGTSRRTRRTFTFHLNKNAKWSDGQPVTADDVVYTVTEAQKDKEIYITNGTYPITAWLATKTVEAVDPNTVKFTLNAPNAVFLENLTDPAHMIMPKHVLSSLDGRPARDRDFATGKGVIGSGPVHADGLHAGPGRSSSPRTRTTSWAHRRSRSSSSASRSTRTRRRRSCRAVSWASCSSSSRRTSQVLQERTGIKVVQIPGVGQQTLQYLTTSRRCRDPRVRQAINYAFDRKTLLATVFQGAGRLLWDDAGFDPDDPKLDHYDFNPDKAKSLLAAAAADSKYDPNTPLRIIYSTQQSGWNEHRRGTRPRPDGDRPEAHDDAVRRRGLDGGRRGTDYDDQPPVLRLTRPRAVEGAGHLQQRNPERHAVRHARSSTRCSTKAAAVRRLRRSRQTSYTQAGQIINAAAP